MARPYDSPKFNSLLVDSALVQIRYGDDETECLVWGVDVDGFDGFLEPDQIPYEAVIAIHRSKDDDFDSWVEEATLTAEKMCAVFRVAMPYE